MFPHISAFFIVKTLIVVCSLYVLLRWCFYEKQINKNKQTAISFSLFGFSVFMVTGLLHNIEISMGFAFGLFAIFSVLRYRTETLETRDMTYLFTTIALSLITAVAPFNLVEIIFVNAMLCGFAKILELDVWSDNLSVQTLTYEKIDNIKPENKALLLADLQQRTGLDVVNVEIETINFLNDSALLKIFYRREDVPNENCNIHYSQEKNSDKSFSILKK